MDYGALENLADCVLRWIWNDKALPTPKPAMRWDSRWEADFTGGILSVDHNWPAISNLRRIEAHVVVLLRLRRRSWDQRGGLLKGWGGWSAAAALQLRLEFRHTELAEHEAPQAGSQFLSLSFGHANAAVPALIIEA